MKCHNCNKTYDDDFNFCPYCGNELIDESELIELMEKIDNYKKLEKYKEAIECCNKIIELDPTDEMAWNNKGYCLGELNRYEEAIECYKKAEEISNSLARRFRT